MSDENLSHKSIFGWKGVIAASIFGIIFMAVLYLAINNEPDYMPSQQLKQQQQQNAEMNMQDMPASHHSH